MSLLPGVTIVNFPVAREDPSEETDEQNLMRCLEASIAACGAKEPRAVVLTNPHNPTGRCYTKPALESVAQFCESNGLHLIMDEVYGLSLLQSSSQETRFISSLSLDLPSLGVNPERVHVLWSTSKDFGSSGFRMVSLFWSHGDRIDDLLKLCVFNRDASCRKPIPQSALVSAC